MNTLLKKAGIPQLHCKSLPGGAAPASFLYEARLPGEAVNSNYQLGVPRVDVEKLWQQVNDLAPTGGLRG